VDAESADATVFGHTVGDLQSDVEVAADNSITGTLAHVDSGSLPAYWGAGNFLVLSLADNDFSGMTSVRVGLEPSAGSGLVEILGDADMNVVMKVSDKDAQVFKVIATDGTNTSTQTYNLSGLTCLEE